jgi:hypothetical protein
MKTIISNLILLFLFSLIVPESSQATPDNPLLVSQKGVYRTYRFQYSDENTTTIFPDRLGKKGSASTFMSNLTFDGDLRVKDYGKVGNENVYSLSFDQVRASRFGMNGHPVFDSPDQFIGKYRKQEVYVCVDGNNEIIRFLFPPKTSQVFKTFMTTAAQEIQVSIREGKKRWTTKEINQHGKGVVDYQVKGAKGSRIELSKTRKNYDYPGLIAPGDKQNIRSSDKIILNQQGFIEEIDKHERSTITAPANKKNILDVKKTLSLKMTGQGNFDPGSFGAKQTSSMLAVYPGEPISDPGQNRELLAKQVNDLIYEDMETWIKHFKPDTHDNRANNAMFYRSSGFVKLQPRSAQRLADFARKKERTSGERTLVMNIFAAAGTESAQNAMRNVLSDPNVRKDTQYGVLIQNFSFMDVKPTAGTIEFLSGLMNRKKGYESYAAAHAFGACIHKLYKRNEKEKSLALNNLIRKKIDGAGNPDERAEYIAALGNAGMFENNRIITGYFKHPNPRVRTEAVMALRKTETADVRDQTLYLFKDEDRGVQRSSIQTYMHFSPDEKNIREIKAQLKAGKIQEANFYDMTSLLKKNIQSHPGLVKDCLKIMVRKKLKDPDLEARIRGMI